MEAKRICGWLRRLLVGLKRGLYAVLGLTAVYLICALIGLIPINNDFEPAAEGIEIFIISNPVHADLVLPLDTGGIDWRALFPGEHFARDTSFATHVAIGWGDRGFFLETPRWSDLRFSTVVRALFWPSPSCLHVSMIDARWLSQARSVRISESQYAVLADYIRSSFARDAAGNKLPVPGAAYAGHDAFFEARGAYHVFNTCNCWVARGMGRAGLRAPWFAPFPKTVWLYLPRHERAGA